MAEQIHSTIHPETSGATQEDEIPSEVPTESGGDGALIDAFSRLSENDILDRSGLAKALKVTTRTVSRMVDRFELPPPIRLAGRSVWIVGPLLEHIRAKVTAAAAEARQRADRIRKLSP